MEIIKKIILLIFIISFFVYPVYAAGLKFVTFEMCLNSAFKNSNDLTVSRMNIEKLGLSKDLQEKENDWKANYKLSLTRKKDYSFSYANYFYSSGDQFKATKNESKSNDLSGNLTLTKKIFDYFTLNFYSKNTINFSDNKSLKTGNLSETLLDNETLTQYETKRNFIENGIEFIAPLYGYETVKKNFQDRKNEYNLLNENNKYVSLFNKIIDDIEYKYNSLLKNFYLKKYYEEDLRFQKEIIDLSSMKTDAGIISINELQDQQMELQTKILKLEKLEKDIELGCMKLNLTCGLNITVETVLLGEIEFEKFERKFEELLELSLKKNDELIQLNNQYVKLVSDKEEIEHKYKPSVNFNVKGTCDGKERDFSEAIKNFEPGYSASLSVDLPFFDGYKKKLDIDIIQKDIEKLNEQMKKIKDNEQLKIFETLNNLQKMEQEYNNILKRIEVTERNIKLAELKYKEGKIDKIELLKLKMRMPSQLIEKIEKIVQYKNESSKLRRIYYLPESISSTK